MITVTFADSRYWGNTELETMEFEDDVTDEEIEEEFKGCVWDRIGDQFGWGRD